MYIKTYHIKNKNINKIKVKYLAKICKQLFNTIYNILNL